MTFCGLTLTTGGAGVSHPEGPDTHLVVILVRCSIIGKLEGSKGDSGTCGCDTRFGLQIELSDRWKVEGKGEREVEIEEEEREIDRETEIERRTDRDRELKRKKKCVFVRVREI